MYGIYANIWGILMVNVTIYSIHGSYGFGIITPKKNHEKQGENASSPHFAVVNSRVAVSWIIHGKPACLLG